jgi:hypothetical protein
MIRKETIEALRSKLLALAAATLILGGTARAEQFTRSVPSGRTSDVHTYRPWDNSCRSAFASAKLMVKPQHGIMSHRYSSSTIPEVDRLSGRKTRCFGKPVTGFVVTYTPARGYRGIDTFTLDMEYPSSNSRRRLIDVFTIQVE